MQQMWEMLETWIRYPGHTIATSVRLILSKGPLKIACLQCHSRESGNPFLNFHGRKMDSRFRGSDIKIKFYE
jgi:hypothetical protein